MNADTTPLWMQLVLGIAVVVFFAALGTAIEWYRIRRHEDQDLKEIALRAANREKR